MQEIKQSCDIIAQLVDKIPAGPIDAFADSKVTKPNKKDVYGSIEGLIQHFELIMTNRGWTPPIAEVYACQESANGELGYYIVRDGTARPWRDKTRPPCFVNYSIMQKITEVHLLSAVVHTSLAARLQRDHKAGLLRHDADPRRLPDLAWSLAQGLLIRIISDPGLAWRELLTDGCTALIRGAQDPSAIRHS